MKVAALLGAVGALAAEVTPLEKVVALLGELQTKVIEEGKNEAQTYDKFACFCKDQSKAKNQAIADNETALSTLNGDLEKQRGIREAKDKEITAKTKELGEREEDVRKTKEAGQKRRNHYAVEITDMTNAVKALEEAIDVLKNSDKTQALLAMKSTLRTAAVMAEALNLRRSRALMQFANDIPEVPTSDYDFHSNDIVETLKELLKEFRKTKERVDSDEVTAQQEETKELQSLHNNIQTLLKIIKDAKSAKSDAVDQIGSLSGDLTISTATLNDDQNYLKDLTDKCNKKSDLWDRRTEMRTGELTAISQALAILHGEVSTANKDLGDNLDRFVQESFVQVSKSEKHVKRMLNKAVVSKRGFMSAMDPRERVMELLRSKSISLKSAVLASLAARAGADPLAKVKKLVEELILRLQQEASGEAEHHGWCVKQTKLAEDKRSTNSQKINNLNGKLAKNEVKRDKLTEDIATLEKEIKELNDSLEKQTKIRGEEKAENEKTVADAKDGNKAVEKAIEVLDQFYKAAANGKVVKNDGKVALVSQGPTADDIPDAGFDEEYGASQDDSTGILGMLEVISSDFERTVSETEKTEKEQAADFLEFKTVTKMSLKEKNVAKDENNNELTRTKDDISKQNEDLDASIISRDAAITELIELHAQCVDTGMSYEERVARREEEIEALKNAYEILSEWKA